LDRKDFKSNKVQMKFFIAILFFSMLNNSFAQDSMFLECSGYRWIEFNREVSEKIKKIQTYEIKNQKLILSDDEKYSFVPLKFSNSEIFYSIKQHPVSIIKNYYLRIDRISGVVEERYDSYPPTEGIFGYWKFEGLCRKTLRKF
jgi:hypothetical protein